MPRLSIVSLVLAAGLWLPVCSQDAPKARPNYELASRWTSAKVSKLVFDTTVNPVWFEDTDRFWYTFETSKGRRWMTVDTVKKTKAPLFDPAHVAAQLTNLVRIPYDSAHLPLVNLKAIKKDTALQFEVFVPKDTKIPGVEEKVEAAVPVKDTRTTVQEQGTEEMRMRNNAPVVPQKAPATMKTLRFHYDLASTKLTLLHPDVVKVEVDKEKETTYPTWASVGPDGKLALFARGFDLYTMDMDNLKKAIKDPRDPSIIETRLTTDGEVHYAYSRHINDEEKDRLRKEQKKEEKKDEKKSDVKKEGAEATKPTPKEEEKDTFEPRVYPTGLVWSQDSTKFTVERRDDRKVADLWVINSLSAPRPKLETYRYAMPGEAQVPQEELWVFDVASRQRVKIKTDAFKDQTLNTPQRRLSDKERRSEVPIAPQWATKGSISVVFLRQSRDQQRIDVCSANTTTGEIKVLVEERLNTYVETRPIRFIEGTQEFVWWSERDGWGHWYLYGMDGTAKGQITRGEFVCGAIQGLDEKTRTLYFTANGREANEDPYYSHLYRVGLDGSNLRLLNAGNADHTQAMPETARFFVDTTSRVDQAPKSVLRDPAGNALLDLEATDTSLLLASGYQFPEPFLVKADDGVTDLAGVMYKPYDFDAKKKYPVITYVYPGPQTEAVSKTFSARNAAHWLAQFGFVVVEVGNRGGTPQRSKWYHNYGYGNLRDYGLADKKAALEQLARKNAYLDISRVGIYGHSGGGFMSTAALLVYPDFFKVAVSSAGNHENNIYNNGWSEKHHGIKEVKDKDGKVKFEYTIDRNSDVAKNLKGKLLLVHGDIDNNVHPANTLRLVDALIKANKRFDMLIIPGARHGFGAANDYFNWVRADYFCKHLLGESNSSVDLMELAREQAQRGERRAQPEEGEQD